MLTLWTDRWRKYLFATPARKEALSPAPGRGDGGPDRQANAAHRKSKSSLGS